MWQGQRYSDGGEQCADLTLLSSSQDDVFDLSCIFEKNTSPTHGKTFEGMRMYENSITLISGEYNVIDLSCLSDENISTSHGENLDGEDAVERENEDLTLLSSSQDDVCDLSCIFEKNTDPTHEKTFEGMRMYEESITLISGEHNGIDISCVSDENISTSHGENLDGEDAVERENEGNNEDCEDISGSLVGLTRKTLDEIYKLYCKHARVLGFSVRKSTSRHNSDGHETGKTYICSCAGKKQTNSDSHAASLERKLVRVTRTECKAFMRAKLNTNGDFEVVDQDMSHNHPLTRKEWNHLHRSEREISIGKGKMIEDMISAGIKTTASYRYMAQNAGGEENLGHTLKDHKNYVNRWKMGRIEGGDAQSLIELIGNQDEEEENFYYKVQVDNDSRLCRLFWRDSMMKEDYETYGDVLVFDTTYTTNKYNLICAPFVGINNHWKNVMFGCAFINDETSISFEWLFGKFKRSMGGKSPTTIFTDQDAAIASAIKKVFPNSRHRLCLWHIQKNAIDNFVELKSNNPFKELFKKCLSGCSNEEEFEICWNDMVSTYGLVGVTWFTKLYNEKEKWCTALSKDFFSAGIISSQRSESTNHAIGFNANKSTSLTDFYGIFEETVKRWRRNEQLDEFQCTRTRFESRFRMPGLLKHASEVYTITIFKHFEEEFDKCIIARSVHIESEDTTVVYNVYSVDVDGKIYQVFFDMQMKLIMCSCKKFEECGLLCYHSLRVLHINSVERIPDCYIQKRWTKLAKSEIWDQFNGGTGKNGDKTSWCHEAARRHYNLVLKCQGNEEAKKYIDDAYARDLLAIDALVANSSAQSEQVVQNKDLSNIVLDPVNAVTKGRKKRIKGHFEKSKKSKRKTIELAKEFGSKTPNARLL